MMCRVVILVKTAKSVFDFPVVVAWLDARCSLWPWNAPPPRFSFKRAALHLGMAIAMERNEGWSALEPTKAVGTGGRVADSGEMLAEGLLGATRVAGAEGHVRQVLLVDGQLGQQWTMGTTRLFTPNLPEAVQLIAGSLVAVGVVGGGGVLV